MHLDGQRLTRIRIRGYLAIPVPAGQHKLTTTESLLGNGTAKVRGETTFAVPAGSTVYLRYTEGSRRSCRSSFPRECLSPRPATFVSYSCRMPRRSQSLQAPSRLSG